MSQKNSSTASAPDPLAPLAELPGVPEAVDKAVDFISRVHRHKANLRGWDVTGSEAVLRGARASAQIDGGTPWLPEDGQVNDPILAGALRAAELLAPDGITETQTTFRRAPLQVIAKINSVASPQMSDEDFRKKAAQSAEFLVPGRPRRDADGRLQLLGSFITGGTKVNAVVLTAVIHGELLALQPFADANGVTARACSRLATISTGLDPRGLGVPEVWWNRHRDEYEAKAKGFASGTAEGVAEWIVFHAEGLAEGTLEAKSIADAKA
ncbi:oxidoreductase [Corynebacterium sp. zg254]|uniref:Fic family protein n=1 Tax=Corynebacterium zhongnanshanii TaxID=2768834 RepID=A0ABQ6VEA1_9CORY|nr:MULTISPECIES: Fic family protein [Corynebacterium]KAB3522638.1 Fic family protein [Corynebacterium zhongnanshanii]MCR5914317.1 oxidoreductase [Corynebacterium sp. zg254]